MMVQSFTPDEQATLVPNKNYWAGKVATVPKVVFVPVRDTNSELNAFRSGEVDVIYPQNQIGLRKKIEAVDGAEYTTTLGPQWEHFDMLSTVPGLDDLAGAQGHRHRDAAPADRRPRREGRQRRRRGAEQHAVHGEPDAAVRAQLEHLPGRRRRRRGQRRSSTPPAGPAAPTACAQKGKTEARVHRRHHLGQPGAQSSPSRSCSSSSRRSA